MAKAIFLIRHGETFGNAARIVQKPEIQLSERGLGQAQRVARRLAEVGIERIVSSDMPRAAMTAEAIRRANAAPLTFNALLHERNFGDLRGTPYSEISFDPFGPDYAPPNGETWEVFHARVDRAWVAVQQVAAATAGNLAVVTHGLVCRSLATRHLRLPEGIVAPESWENTSVTVIECPAPWRVSLLNCVVHLDALDGAPAANTGVA